MYHIFLLYMYIYKCNYGWFLYVINIYCYIWTEQHTFLTCMAADYNTMYKIQHIDIFHIWTYTNVIMGISEWCIETYIIIIYHLICNIQGSVTLFRAWVSDITLFFVKHIQSFSTYSCWSAGSDCGHWLSSPLACL